MGKRWLCQYYKSSFQIEIILLCQCFQIMVRWCQAYDKHKIIARLSPPPPPFPSSARVIFALLILIRPHYTIWEPGTGYTCMRLRKWYNRSFLVLLYIWLTWIINGRMTVDSYEVVSDSQLTRFCVEGFKTSTPAAFWIRRAHSTRGGGGTPLQGVPLDGVAFSRLKWP